VRSCRSIWVEPRGLQAKSLELFGRWFGAVGILATVQVSGDGQAGFGLGCANEVQDLLITIEWFAGPVFGDLGEEAVLDGVPCGRASRVVPNGESQSERIGELRLEFGFPGSATVWVLFQARYDR
jgi:hypothetical protein